MKNLFNKIIKIKIKLLAKAYLWRYNPSIVGITGSSGKTSTKDAVETVLSHDKTVRSSPEGMEPEIGIPLAILGDWKEIGGFFFWVKVITVSFLHLLIGSKSYPEVLILEYKVERPGDMKKLLSIVRPTIGVITEIGEVPVHVEFFSGAEALAREKSKLINQLPTTGFAVLNTDNDIIVAMKDQTRAHIVSYGFSDNSDIKITSFESTLGENQSGLAFKLNYGGSFIPVRLDSVLGKSKAYAAASAASVGIIFGINLVSISESLELFRPSPGRLKVLDGIKNTKIIDDSYGSSPSSMEEALSVFKNIKNRKVVVLGGMLEIGKYTFEVHENLGKKLSKLSDVLITVGMRGKIISESAIKAGMSKNKVHHFVNLREAKQFLQGSIKEDDVILIKGAMPIRMEKIVKEVMARPSQAEELLVRQSKEWEKEKSVYE